MRVYGRPSISEPEIMRKRPRLPSPKRDIVNRYRLQGALLSVLFLSALLSACGGGGSSTESQVPSTAGGSGPTTPSDTTPPVITLVGETSMTWEGAVEWIEPGYSATDETDGTVEVSVTGGIDTSILDVYTLTYSATDAAGNQSSVERIVTVEDTTAPAVTLIGSASMTLSHDASYQEQGATALDSVDGDLEVDISGFVGSAADTYPLTYTATDLSGNPAQKTRYVTVEPAPEDPPASGGTGGADDDSTDQAVFTRGVVDDLWDAGIKGWDETDYDRDCSNDGGAACPSISWGIVTDPDRGDVLQITHAGNNLRAGVYFAVSGSEGVDVTGFQNGDVEFDVKVISGDANITMKLDCFYPCSSGEQNLGARGVGDWEAISVPFSQLTPNLDLTKVNTGLVIWATNFGDTVFQIDNVRFTGFDATAEAPSTPAVTVPFTLTAKGLGSYSDTINPASYRCANDNGAWLYNAGVIPTTNLGTCQNVEQARPSKRMPQLGGAALEQHTMTHRWWGSLSFIGEMRVGDATMTGYITPDPIMARLTERGVRIRGIPTGLKANAGGFGNSTSIPVPFDEVYDGVAVANSSHQTMDAKLLSYSEGSVTAGWFDGDVLVMEATFVYGSPYVFFEVYEGSPVLKMGNLATREIWHRGGNSLGLTTDVSGQTSHVLLIGDDGTVFGDIESDQIAISAPGNSFTLAWASDTTTALRQTLESLARNTVKHVTIDYSVDRSTNTVTVSHRYLDTDNNPVETMAGLMPLHWKRAPVTNYVASVRSARGLIKFAPLTGFDYELPSVGVLPALPVIDGALIQEELVALVEDFVARGSGYWNTANDTYWNGKAVGRLSEVLAIADQLGMSEEAATLRTWLKGELADWMSAERDGTLDSGNYFVYDADWSTLLGLEESFYSHTLLQDHHFHYGYFIRAAAEVCRVDKAFCGPDQYGQMFELLIRDYAGGRNDSMFPYLRNFDPANGFSWASGEVNFVRGNNNESTSEAANAYGAMVLYGLVTGNDDIVERGMYLHASTSATYWEYWNDIDGWRGGDSDARNFPPDYPRITTSIIWGDGSAFATWFSPAFAHILGIQGLPSNPLIMHVGLYADYLEDYVALGLEESSNGKPSGLPDGEWTDLWWNLWSMTDPEAAIADYEATTRYNPEAGEAPAHTYQWIYTMRALGKLQTGTGALTADYPSAMAFQTDDGLYSYVVYNYGDEVLTVTFSDGTVVEAPANAFAVERR